MAKDKNDDIHKEALDAFKRCEDAETENREKAKFDLRFARNDEQWPEHIKKEREADGRPCLTLNKLKPVIRQIVNDGRQNKPQITVHPRDHGSDPEVATIINGVIRQIEQGSAADDAYDTALDHSVTMGFGFIRVNTKYSHDDTFEQDIIIQRVADPFTIFGDPDAQSLDGSDWNVAFVTESMTKEAFELRYPDAEATDWVHDYKTCGSSWYDDNKVTVAEYWTRQPAKRTIHELSDGVVMDDDVLKENLELLHSQGVTVVRTRQVDTWKVMMHLVTGAEVLESREWGGRHIPIVPVYGEEIFIDGQRHLQGIVRSAIPAQQNFNYWRTNATETVALAPLAPWVGPVGAFETDAAKWATANRHPWATLEYDVVGDTGQEIAPPTRGNNAQVPAAAIAQAANAADDIKAITGLHDASLGAPSNETSGKAISLRQHEGDVSTFHFVDNLAKSIRQLGRILLELIPTVYSAPRVLRILGEDGMPAMVPINQPVIMTPQGPQPAPQANPMNGAQPQIDPNLIKIYDLTAGKYDLTVKVGPSFTTQREETANQMMQFIQAFPQAAPFVGDLLAQNLDWPGADKLSERLKAMLPPQAQGEGQNPQMQQAKQAMQKLMAEFQACKAENDALKSDKGANIKKLQIDAFEADTNRIEALGTVVKDFASYGIDPMTAMQMVGQSPDMGLTMPGFGPPPAPMGLPPGMMPMGPEGQPPMQGPGPMAPPSPAFGINRMSPPGSPPGNPALF